MRAKIMFKSLLNRLFNRVQDDGIDFQWGDRYIKSQEIRDEGGKYWKDNKDGTITEFSPPELRFKTIRISLKNTSGLNNFKVLENYALEFENESVADKVIAEFDDWFWSVRGITAEKNGKVVTFHISAEVREHTYTPES